MHRHSAHHRQPQFSKTQHHAFCLRKATHSAAALGQTLKSLHKQFLLDAFYNVANACQTGALRQHEVEAVANITLSVLDGQRTPQKHCIDRDLLCTLFTLS